MRRRTQTTGNQAYVFRYTYNAAQLMTSMTYPSGRVVNYSYSPAARVTTLSGQMGNSTTNYAGTSTNPITYAPQGSIASMPLGTSNPLTEQRCYNSRLQPVTIRLGGAANS